MNLAFWTLGEGFWTGFSVGRDCNESIVPKQSYQATVIEPAGFNAIIVSTMTKGEMAEIALYIIAANIPIICNHQQRLTVRPPKAIDMPLVP